MGIEYEYGGVRKDENRVIMRWLARKDTVEMPRGCCEDAVRRGWGGAAEMIKLR
ncbi:MAG TPA: hypothetical protein VHT73_05570 [Thermodesulfobacteriota bacterium]|nr:hypothetical protein [Thermodesulfobacteriota bacterium]